MRKSLALVTVLAGTLIISAACSPKSANRGHIPPPSQLEKLEVGKHSKDYVRNVLGTPSTVGTFDKEVWYYIGRRVEQWAFLQESIIEQKVVAIYFDKQAILPCLSKYIATTFCSMMDSCRKAHCSTRRPI